MHVCEIGLCGDNGQQYNILIHADYLRGLGLPYSSRYHLSWVHRWNESS